MGDAKLVDKGGSEYKLKYSEAGKGFFGGGRKLSEEGRDNYEDIFGKKKMWFEERDS